MAETRATKSGTPKPEAKERLTRDAWLDAAAAAIAVGGFDNVRVLVLAKHLGVSRGSFYWHFRDHRDLVVSFLERWRERRLRELAYWRPDEGGPEGGLRRALQLLFSEPARDMRRIRVELGVRDFARRDALAAEVAAEVDRARIAQYETLLARLEVPVDESRELAQLLYVATVGSQLVLTGAKADEPTIARTENLIARLVAKWRQAPDTGDGSEP
jgi:AcrR family transcriptional regulator